MMHHIPLTDTADAALRIGSFSRAEWLLECRVMTLEAGTHEQRSPAGESFLLVLSGTHDLYAGGGSWLQRGVRTEPFAGRPVGIFLPPGTPYRLANGRGRALLFAARQPQLPASESPKDVLSKQPLLQMAGSGKAFDPASGTWKPKESFLASSEAILPRRIAQLTCGDVRVQRLLDVDYKALGMCIDEVALAAGQSVDVPPHAATQAPREIACYYETEGTLTIGDCSVSGTGLVQTDALPTLTATAGRAYVAIVYAGPKSTT